MTALYDHIGTTYLSSRGADPEIVAALGAMLQLNSASMYLDLACGTGNYTRALAARGGIWHGIDASDVMLAQARTSSTMVNWLKADASDLPFRDQIFDGTICTLAIHHFNDLLRPFREVRRTMKRGRFVLFTGLAEQMRNYWLCHYFPDMMRRSIESMPTLDAIQTSLEAAGFADSECVPFSVDAGLRDLFLYSGKYRPHLYLQPEVRANISSFARLCTSDELDRGLRALVADLDSGNFASVCAAYDSSEGDYAFVMAHARA